MAFLKILNKNFEIVDTIEKMTIADSFVVRSNKIGGGNGEAKFYVGNDNAETRDFFGGANFNINCFLLKKDLIKFLQDSKSEYLNPEQPYQRKDLLPNLWLERYNKINLFEEEIIYFPLFEQVQIAGPRVYVKSSNNNTAYSLIRELALPNISYLSAIKLLDEDHNFIYYFRPFVDYFGELENPEIIEQEIKILEENLPAEEKRQLIKARKGQGKYRQKLLEECPYCPITLISDDRLLIASHIKPWVKSNELEKLDPKNGFMFTPTYDFLFDRGYISFTDDKKILISPWLSKMTVSKLNISPEKAFNTLPVDGRQSYLEYHRNEIFKN